MLNIGKTGSEVVCVSTLKSLNMLVFYQTGTCHCFHFETPSLVLYGILLKALLLAPPFRGRGITTVHELSPGQFKWLLLSYF